MAPSPDLSTDLSTGFTAGLSAEPRLLPGIPVARRDAEHLQVGVEDRCVVLPDQPEVRTLLQRLTGVGSPPVPGPDVSPAILLALARLARAGLLVDRATLGACLTTYADGPAQRAAALASVHSSPRDAAPRWAARSRASVHVDAAPADRSVLEQVLVAGGVRKIRDACRVSWRDADGSGDGPDLVVLLRDGEPDREELDRLQHDDVPHLLVRTALDHVVVGPFVEPARTACVRCLDAHRTEGDPRWPLVLAQQVGVDLPAVRDPALWQVALGWAARDVLRWLDGEEPSTWSATVRIGPDLQPRHRSWRRHPRCGCGWADLVGAGGKAAAGDGAERRTADQNVESSLPSFTSSDA